MKKHINIMVLLVVLFSIIISPVLAVDIPDSIGTVNGENLSYKEFKRLFNAQKRKFYSGYSFDLFSKPSLEVKLKRQDYLKKAANNGYIVSQSSIDKVWDEFLEDVGGVQNLEKKAKEENLTIADIKNKLAENLAMHKYFEKTTKEKLVEMMVNELLVLQEAKARNITVSEPELDKKLNSIKEKQGGEEGFKVFLSQNNATIEDAKNEIKNQILYEITKAEISSTLKNGETLTNYLTDKKKNSLIIVYTDKLFPKEAKGTKLKTIVAGAPVQENKAVKLTNTEPLDQKKVNKNEKERLKIKETLTENNSNPKKEKPAKLESKTNADNKLTAKPEDKQPKVAKPAEVKRSEEKQIKIVKETKSKPVEKHEVAEIKTKLFKKPWAPKQMLTKKSKQLGDYEEALTNALNENQGIEKHPENLENVVIKSMTDVKSQENNVEKPIPSMMESLVNEEKKKDKEEVKVVQEIQAKQNNTEENLINLDSIKEPVVIKPIKESNPNINKLKEEKQANKSPLASLREKMVKAKLGKKKSVVAKIEQPLSEPQKKSKEKRSKIIATKATKKPKLKESEALAEKVKESQVIVPGEKISKQSEPKLSESELRKKKILEKIAKLEKKNQLKFKKLDNVNSKQQPNEQPISNQEQTSDMMSSSVNLNALNIFMDSGLQNVSTSKDLSKDLEELRKKIEQRKVTTKQ